MSNKAAILKMKNDLLVSKTLPGLFARTLIEAMGEQDVTVGDFLGYCEASECIEAAVTAHIATLAPVDLEPILTGAVFTAPKVMRQSPYGEHQPGSMRRARAFITSQKD